MEAPYPDAYLGLQVRHARAMAALTHQPLAAALMTQTSLYKLLGAPGAFDPDKPIWRELVACVDERANVDEQSHVIYEYYLKRYPAIPTFGQERHWGCFSFDWRPM